MFLRDYYYDENKDQVCIMVGDQVTYIFRTRLYNFMRGKQDTIGYILISDGNPFIFRKQIPCSTLNSLIFYITCKSKLIHTDNNNINTLDLIIQLD